jgi:hypothetical protein
MKQAIIKIDLKLLRDFMRLPQTTTIMGVRADPDNPRRVILEIEDIFLPDGDEITAEYIYYTNTLPVFQKWRSLEKEETKA